MVTARVMATEKGTGLAVEWAMELATEAKRATEKAVARARP